jgi:hypothetical protein
MEVVCAGRKIYADHLEAIGGSVVAALCCCTAGDWMEPRLCQTGLLPYRLLLSPSRCMLSKADANLHP